jgi:hypothetical protein
MAKNTRWDRNLSVAPDAEGLIGHAGAASHELIKHLLSMSSPRRILLFTCGWMITAADEDAIRQVPADAWKPGTGQDGSPEDDKDVAEITGLMTRAGNWPGGLRWIARRVKPFRRHLKNLTEYERKTGWKYSITCTNIPDSGIPGVPGSHHPQYIDTVHRQHAVVETGGVRTAKAMGLRNPGRRHSQPAGTACAPCPHPPDQPLRPRNRKGDHPGAVGAGARSGHTGRHRHPPGTCEPDTTTENRHNTISN